MRILVLLGPEVDIFSVSCHFRCENLYVGSFLCQLKSFGFRKGIRKDLKKKKKNSC